MSDEETKSFDWQKLVYPILAAVAASVGTGTYSHNESSALAEYTKVEALKQEKRTQERIELLERQTQQLVFLWNMTQSNKVRDVLNELPPPDKFQ